MLIYSVWCWLILIDTGWIGHYIMFKTEGKTKFPKIRRQSNFWKNYFIHINQCVWMQKVRWLVLILHEMSETPNAERSMRPNIAGGRPQRRYVWSTQLLLIFANEPPEGLEGHLCPSCWSSFLLFPLPRISIFLVMYSHNLSALNNWDSVSFYLLSQRWLLMFDFSVSLYFNRK